MKTITIDRIATGISFTIQQPAGEIPDLVCVTPF